MSAPTPSVTSELRTLLRRLRLGPMADTLPERVVLARQSHMPHVDFLELVLTDEFARRERTSAGVPAKAAHLDPTMVLEAWDDTAEVTYDKAIWGELATLRFVEDAHNALILGPTGVGKTFLATPLLAERGVSLSAAQTYRLVAGQPERLSLMTLAALCDIFNCTPGDLIATSATTTQQTPKAKPARPGARQPRRARITKDR